MIESQYSLKASIYFVSSCLFLRYICPAIHGPVLFGLASSVPEQTRVSRNLTLVAKVLQTMANLASFEDKEIHMKRLNKFVDQEIPHMHQYLSSIACTNQSNQFSLDHENSYCHQFIDLSYEFAKLCNLFYSQVDEFKVFAICLIFCLKLTSWSIIAC